MNVPCTIEDLERLLRQYRRDLLELAVEEEFKDKLYLIIASNKANTREDIAKLTGRTNSPWLRTKLAELVQEGLIVCKTDQRPYYYKVV